MAAAMQGATGYGCRGDFNFESAQHYSATITSKGRMAGALISDVETKVVGERVGDCAK